MAALLFLAPLLLLGAGRAQAEVQGCPGLGNATEGNFTVETEPKTYSANTSYEVMIRDGRNHSSSTGWFLLQALSPQNASVGRWKGAPTADCGSVDTAILNITQDKAQWKSPGGNLSSVQFRVYLSLPGNTPELETVMLNRGAEATTPRPHATSSPTPSSVCRAGSSSLLLAVLQLLLLLFVGSLLS